MENKNRAWTKWLFWFSLAVAVVVIYKTLDNFGEIAEGIKSFFRVISPFLGGVLIAYILYVPCKKLEQYFRKVKKVKFVGKRARGISILSVYLIALLLIALLINVILPLVVQSVVDLASNFTSYYNLAISKINAMPEDSVLKSKEVQDVIAQFRNIDLTKILNMDNITNYIQSIVGMLGGIFDIFVAIIVSVYILGSRSKIIRFWEKLLEAIFEENANKNINKYFNRTNEIFFNFLASQIIDAIIVGVLTSIVMAILGVRYAVLLGFMIGLFNIIPYFGAIVAITIAGLITLLTGGIWQAIIMLIVVIVIQQIDANVINPKIIGSSLKISPLLVIISVMIGGAYFGVLGMFLAVPVAAVLKLLLDDYIEWKRVNKK